MGLNGSKMTAYCYLCSLCENQTPEPLTLNRSNAHVACSTPSSRSTFGLGYSLGRTWEVLGKGLGISFEK